MNEETFIESGRPTIQHNAVGKKNGETWKYVTLGGVSGIFLGAGGVYAGHTIPKAASIEDFDDEAEDEELENEEVEETDQQDNQVGLHSANNSSDEVRVAEVNDGMSFGEAFAAARSQVGPGGVFHWHGGVYGTYYADEWNAMTAAEKHEYAERVQPEIRANQLSTPTDAHPDVVVHDQVQEEQEGVTVVSDIDEQQIAENFDMGEDVHIVGYTDVEGHLAVGYDVEGDGMADVAIIDMDDDLMPSEPDIIVDTEGNMTTVGEMINDYTPDVYDSQQDTDVASYDDPNDMMMSI